MRIDNKKIYIWALAVLSVAVIMKCGCGVGVTDKIKSETSHHIRETEDGSDTRAASLTMVSSLSEAPTQEIVVADALPQEETSQVNLIQSMIEQETKREILFDADEISGAKDYLKQSTSLPDISEIGEYNVLQDPKMYTYKDMQQDIALLVKKHSEIVSCDSLGTTDDGRELYHLVIGSKNAEHKILIDASIHGREYITAQLVMKMCVSFVEHASDSDTYHDIAYSDLINKCAVHIVPMVNPDGVTLSQFGLEGLNKTKSVEKVERIAGYDGKSPSGEYLRRWKANINGVDLNRNFDGNWDGYEDTIGHPSSEHYKGIAPVCETESKAMVKLTEAEMFDYIANYHAQGRMLYWYYGEKGERLDKIKTFMRVLESLTYYTADEAHHGSSDSAGYRDWTAGNLGIPSITVEVGYDYAPVDPAQFSGIWKENKSVIEEMCLLCQ